MTDLIDRLLAPDWHDPSCPFPNHCYCGDDAPHDVIRHPLAREAADELSALRERVKALEAQLLAKKDADLDRHIFAWFNDLDCDEMRRCLEDYDARQQRADPEPEYSGWVEVVEDDRGADIGEDG